MKFNLKMKKIFISILFHFIFIINIVLIPIFVPTIYFVTQYYKVGHRFFLMYYINLLFMLVMEIKFE